MGMEAILESSLHSMPSSVINGLCLTLAPLHLPGLQGFSMWGLGCIAGEREDRGGIRRRWSKTEGQMEMSGEGGHEETGYRPRGESEERK